MITMTLKKLVETAVAGLKNNFYSEQDRAKLVDYLLENSSLQVTKEHFLLQSGSLMGIGKETYCKELPYIPTYLTFFWGDYDVTNPDEEREWQFNTYPSLETLELLLKSQTTDSTFDDGSSGELVVLINGIVQRYKHVISMDTNNYKNYIEWEDLEPYKINIITHDNKVETENYNSRTIVQLRILQLIRDKVAQDIQVYTTPDNATQHFTVSRVEFSTSKSKEDEDLHLFWQGNWGMPDEDEIF